MKNTMLMMSKIKVGEGTLLTSILVISVLGVLSFLILNRNQKLKYLKKLTSVALILTMLLLPFSSLLNVKAEETTINVDENISKSDTEKDSKKVINTANLYLSDIADEDTFSAYKILDTYYDKNTNEISYKFTDDFQNFINQLTSSDDFSNLTVENYQELSSDESTDTIYTTKSTLNKLVSKYATYIRKQTSGTITSIKLVKDSTTSKRVANNVQAGSYVILPDKVVQYQKESDVGISVIEAMTYGVMVANVEFTVENNTWKLSDCEISTKSSIENFGNVLLNADFNNIMTALENGEFSRDLVYVADEGLLFMSQNGNKIYENGWVFPANTHDSIKNNATIDNLLRQRKYIFPKGITHDKIYVNFNYELQIRDNKAYYTQNGTEILFAEVTENNNELNAAGEVIGTSITFSKITSREANIIFELKIDSNLKTGLDTDKPENSGNKIISSFRYLKDPYMDIGTNPTDEDINKVLGIANDTNIVYTYGMNITNQDNNSNALSGAEFQLYSDKECTIPVGDKIVIGTDGNAIFKGMNDTDTYYLKQVKAVTGYRLMTDVIEVSKDKFSLTNGLYNITVTNTKIGLLPSTGGLGTIFYTLVGLIIIGLGGYEVVKYSKKQVNR